MRRLSIDWKFPMLMSGLVLATAVLFVWAAYSQFAGSLYTTSGERLRTSALLVANMISDGAPRREAQMTGISRDPAVVEFLKSGAGRKEALAAIERSSAKPAEMARWRVQLLDRDGNDRASVTWHAAAAWPDWARRSAAGRALGRQPVTISPIIDFRDTAQYQVVSPVFASTSSADTDAIIGYVVETRAVVGRGQKAVQDLIGGGAALMVGSPGGSWTDLQEIVPAPPAVAVLNTPVLFDSSARGAGIGILQPVRGTPWLVWLQQPKELVLAPVRQFAREIVPRAALIALLGALLVWLFSRRITRRIVGLTRDIDRLAVDGGTEPVPAREGFDEIDRLYGAFERMAHRVRTHQELEAQLRQAQKLEAVGRLAGGIAHDFNNILTVVHNYSELVRAELPPDGALSKDIDEVLHATDRAKGLTRQLLAFSRHQVVTPRIVDLNEAIEGSGRLLRRLIPANIELVTTLDPKLGRIMADPGHIEQVMLNLTINAADAMPAGGRITIHTQNAELDDTFSRSGAASGTGNGSERHGRHASIVFTDTGSGMDKETCSRVFDPFFTTKPLGKGTGLGLATVHGIVTQNNGRIWVYSEPGRGTTFKLYFPVVTSDTQEHEIEHAMSEVRADARGTETILVVEDDPAAREVIRRLLSKRGYSVLEAGNGVEGLAIVESFRKPIDLVLTDLMMPEMSGSELSERLAITRPDLPVLLMSGYADYDIRDKNLVGGSRAFIEKPFTAAAMLAFIRTGLSVRATV